MDLRRVATTFLTDSEFGVRGDRDGVLAAGCNSLGVHRWDCSPRNMAIQGIDSRRSVGEAGSPSGQLPSYRQGYGMFEDRAEVVCHQPPGSTMVRNGGLLILTLHPMYQCRSWCLCDGPQHGRVALDSRRLSDMLTGTLSTRFYLVPWL